jgi:hypothetical protein
MKRLLAISIASASASIAIGAIPVLAEVDAKIHKLCIEAKDYAGCVQTQISLSTKIKAVTNTSEDSQTVELTPWEKHLNEQPDLKAWVEANPALGKKKKEEWVKNNSLEISDEEGRKIYYPLDGYIPPDNPSDYKVSSCPPGKSLRQKTTFLGLIKLGKVCLSDYEVEVLRQGERHRAMDNFSDSMNRLSESMKPPRVINCYSNTYGNYTSTSCY